MAFTKSMMVNTVVGNQRKVAWRVTTDSAAEEFDTGLSVVDDFSVALQSCTTAAPGFTINELSAGTAAAGYINISACNTGDEFLLTVYGR